MSKKLAKSFLIYGMGVGLSQSILIFLVPVYTRYFSAKEYGSIDLINSGFILLSIFGLLQIESAVGRYYYEAGSLNKRREYISTAFWTILGLSVLLALLVSVFSNELSLMIFKTRDLHNVIIVAALAVPFMTLFSFFAVMIRYENKPVVYCSITLIQIGSTIGLSLWLIIIKKIGISGVFYGQLFGYAIGFSIYLYFFRNYIRLIFIKKILNQYFQFSLPILPGVIGGWANSNANRFIMLSMLTVSDIGIYAVAFKIASAFKLLELAFRMAWQPFFIEHYKLAGHRTVYIRIFKYVAIALAVLVLFTFVFAKVIVHVAASPAFYESYKLIGWISMSFAFLIISSTVTLGPILKLKTIYNTYSYFISVIVNFSFLYLLIPIYGIMGVAYSMVIGNLALLISGWFFSERLYPVFITRKQLIRRFRKEDLNKVM